MLEILGLSWIIFRLSSLNLFDFLTFLEGFGLLDGAQSRNRTGMAVLWPRDFKSLVSTYFTIWAMLTVYLFFDVSWCSMNHFHENSLCFGPNISYLVGRDHNYHSKKEKILQNSSGANGDDTVLLE